MLEVHAILQRQRCNENITKKTGTLSDAYDKKTEEWKREVFRIRGSLGQERIPDKKGLQSRRMESKVVLPETAGNITEDKKE